VGNSFMHESFERGSADVIDNASNHVALALYGADNWRLARANAASPATAAALVLVPVLCEPTDESFVKFNNTAELFYIFDQGDADLVAHHPCGFVGTKTHVAENLQCTHALFAGEHEMDDLEPIAERLVGVLKNSPDQDRKPIAVRGALRALPMPLAGSEIIDLRIAASRTMDAIGPAPSLQIGFAGILMREKGVELGGGKLVDRLRARASWHGSAACERRRILP